ncbi:MAG TPA: Fe-S cluster assembly protein SufD [Vicinamibacterales bacterium]|nr:Fe-S cluster assembly protein SufD [Vicinamibacterales bacterium]
MAQVAERHETYSVSFDAFRRTPAFGQGALADAREAAFGRFLAHGFPTTREEEWKFTNVAPVAATPFVPAAAATPDRAALEPWLLSDGVAARIVVVNGRRQAALSSQLPAGVTLRALTPREVPAARATATPFADLNAAFFEEAIVLEVAPNTVVTGPIDVLIVSAPGTVPALVSPRLRIVVGGDSEVTIIERYAGLGGQPSLTNAVTDVVLGPNARANHVKVQDEPPSAFHLASLFVHQDRTSTFRSQAITFGGRIARNDIVATLDGEGAECTLNGLYIATGESLVDTHTTIDHAKPHCPSHELYKGILAGKSRAVFNGKIIVRQDAQKTDAKQTNKALLLTDDAQVNTKPQLEIFADDVKCTHGAAIGQLDDDALFYLRARGISMADARHMLIEAFAGEVLDGIPVAPVRERLMQTMEEKLAGR